MAIGVLGLGGYAPPTVVTNDEVGRWCDTSPEWIVERTGVHERRYGGAGIATSDMAAAAVREALVSAQVSPDQVGFLTVGTCTPDQPQPASAVHVQRKAGLAKGPAVDVNAVCSGFVYALVMTAAYLSANPEERYGVCVGADKFSPLLDRADKRTAPL